MEYRKSEAKEYAKQHIFRGVWAASTTPYTPDYKIDYEGFRHNMRHYIDNLQLDGLFLDGLMGEGFHHTIAERKKLFEIAVEEANGKMFVMPYTSDPVLENVLDMTKYAEEIGADFAIIINPKFYFGAMTGEGIYQYYKYVADRVNIGIALFNQMEHGYLISPEVIDRIAEIPNIVGLKHTGPPGEVQRTRSVCGNKIVIVANEGVDWLVNLTVNGVEAMLPSPTPYVLQSKKLRLIKEYTTLAVKGDMMKAWETCKRLEPIRTILSQVTVLGKVQATYKYWCQSLGMVGGDGRVRLPQIELTEAEKKAIKTAVESTELVGELAMAKAR